MYVQVLYMYVPVVDRLGQNSCWFAPSAALCSQTGAAFAEKLQSDNCNCLKLFCWNCNMSAATATCLLPNYMIAAHAHLSLARVS